ncbi:MAG: anthranilate synthase component I family protein [Desulfobacterales bacterium]|nr:anthranilate synthase component I family protein [Desulfobacterales bacterium]
MLLSQFPELSEFKKLAQQFNVIPVCVEILADTETPVSLLRKVHHSQKPAFLFESVEGGERWGRYSFLSTSIRSHVRVYAEYVEIEQEGQKQQLPHGGNPLSVLRMLMSRYRAAQVPGLPRFWGGLVGYMTYEMVSFFEAIPNRMPPEKPIAHFIIPDGLLIFDNIRHTLLAVRICFLDEQVNLDKVFGEAREKINAFLDKMEQHLPEKQKHPNPAGCHLAALWEDDRYCSLVHKVKEYILAGDVIQTVISQPFGCSPAPDLWSLYRAQRFINPSPYLYFLHLDDTTLIGSSPETMVRLENGIATLRPIAGTRPRGKTEQEDRSLADELLSDVKERAEHLMLVDLGRNDLGRVAETGTVQVTDLMVVERYSHVMHLVSNICCDVKPKFDAWDLLQATFPAGTLSGAPKVRAMEIIAEQEQGPRGPYGGAVGYVSFSGNMDMAITIRTACVENDHLTVRAGAGIVADSDPERERIETENKAMAIQKALQLIRA